MGWIPEYPSYKDYTFQKDDIEIKTWVNTLKMSKFIGVQKEEPAGMDPELDLRNFCSEIEDQGSLGSCTACAAIGLVEYYEKKAFGRYINASKRFLYKVTRNILKWTGDTGAFTRSTMGAMVIFGVPPEDYWPYDIDGFDIEPNAFCYSFAKEYQTIKYLRLDPPNFSRDSLLIRIKTNLMANIPAMFGFTVFQSIWEVDNSGHIPFPDPAERVLGGHAVVAVGYKDDIDIKNPINEEITTGALLIRNSWGKEWGEKGYGWLPYKYVIEGLAIDWWTILKKEWVNTGKFGIR